ncbi:hypothetical protein AQBE111736_10900 [Aquirufa beregesia]
MFAVSALYSINVVVATPLLKVRLVAVPKSVLPTFGAVDGDEELFAPEKTKLLTPVYAVTVSPSTSTAVIVMFCDAPAV